MPEPPAPVASPPPEVVARPAPEPDTTTGPHTLRWAFASMLVLAAGVLAYYRVTSGAQALVTPVATLRFAPHWDAGAQRIGSVGPLSSGSGVRLLSGLGIGAATIEEDRPATASTRRLRP